MYNKNWRKNKNYIDQKNYEEKNGPGAHAAWMAAVGKDYLNA